MTSEHLSALLSAAEAKTDDAGWAATEEERTITLYVSRDGASLTVARLTSIKPEGDLVFAKNVRGETFVLALADLFAGSVEGQKDSGRKAGFSAR